MRALRNGTLECYWLFLNCEYGTPGRQVNELLTPQHKPKG
jgi:hypothetical protein